jgi:hypothetical protein
MSRMGPVVPEIFESKRRLAKRALGNLGCGNDRNLVAEKYLN